MPKIKEQSEEIPYKYRFEEKETWKPEVQEPGRPKAAAPRITAAAIPSGAIESVPTMKAPEIEERPRMPILPVYGTFEEPVVPERLEVERPSGPKSIFEFMPVYGSERPELQPVESPEVKRFYPSGRMTSETEYRERVGEVEQEAWKKEYAQPFSFGERVKGISHVPERITGGVRTIFEPPVETTTTPRLIPVGITTPIEAARMRAGVTLGEAGESIKGKLEGAKVKVGAIAEKEIEKTRPIVEATGKRFAGYVKAKVEQLREPEKTPLAKTTEAMLSKYITPSRLAATPKILPIKKPMDIRKQTEVKRKWYFQR